MAAIGGLLIAMLVGVFGGPVAAQTAPRADDRAAIDACLKSEENAPQRCIGTVYKLCSNRPRSDDAFSPGSTPGQENCAGRELAVWQAKIDAAVKALRDGPLGHNVAQPWNQPAENNRAHAVLGREIIDDMQRAWRSASAKMCDTRALRYEDGTFARTVYATCLYEETARHALWLQEVANDQDIQSAPAAAQVPMPPPGLTPPWRRVPCPSPPHAAPPARFAGEG